MAVAAGFVAFTLPPRRQPLAAAPDGTIAGVLHVHTSRSDGSDNPDGVAAAAARAGLRFVVFTDHGDGTRRPDPPTYRSGVLCIDAVELSTSGGHYIALDVGASPYPLGGEPRDVVEDVRRLGGFGIVAHPDSPKPELRWSGWRSPFDGVEMLNLDTSWRRVVASASDRSASVARRLGGAARLAEALLDYPFRKPETIARAAARQRSDADATIALDRLERRIVTTAGADAHANIEPRGDPGSDGHSLFKFPGYEPTFRALSVHVATDRPLTGDAANDARLVMRAVRNGHLYAALDGLASPPSFEFTASNQLGIVHEGDELGAGGPVALHVRSNAPPGFVTTVYGAHATIAADRAGDDVRVDAAPTPDVYWVEIGPARGNAPWIRSNAIYIRGAEPPVDPTPPHLPPTASEPLLAADAAAGKWRIERDELSQAAMDWTRPDGRTEIRLRWGLAGGSKVHQYVGLAVDTPDGVASSNRLAFTARGEHPMRVSVQLRGRAADQRWQRSVFVPAFAQERTVYFDDLHAPVGASAGRPVDLAAVRTILFVIDTTNTKPGASGRLWIRDVQLQR